jgi:hypothetical protein
MYIYASMLKVFTITKKATRKLSGLEPETSTYGVSNSSWLRDISHFNDNCQPFLWIGMDYTSEHNLHTALTTYLSRAGIR